MMKNLGILILLLLSHMATYGQQFPLSGQVKTASGKAIRSATVEIIETATFTTTDSAGNFLYRALKPGKYTIRATSIGYRSARMSVTLGNSKSTPVVLVLEPENNRLDEVTVVGKSAAELKRTEPIRSAVISMRDRYEQSSTLTELINRTAGLRIRQTGGLGSATELSLNGFQGKSIRYFKDGIPLDYLRDGFNISSVPVNMLERIEVYKGVLPVSLGADALGGAVNLVSRQQTEPFASFSYEMGSFNTHRLTVNGMYTDTTGHWFAGTNSFFNYSDNDYNAAVKVTDPETKNQTIQRVRLFHNAFRNYYSEVFFGLNNRSWADEIKVSLTAFGLKRQQQHPVLMTDPYGAIQGHQKSIFPSVSYRKSFFDHRLNVSQFLVYNKINVGRRDTVHGRYDWHGTFFPDPARTGESRQPSLSDINFSNLTSRTNLSFALINKHTLELNLVSTSFNRTGEDPYGPRFNGTETDVLSAKATYNKIVSAIGLQSLLSARLSNTLIGKYYHYRSSGIEAWEGRTVSEIDRSTKSGNYWGIADALKYTLNDNSILRFSFEAANRLPEQEELFGDGVWVVPNFNLSPERSLNFNLGYRTSHTGKYTAEVNTFYRNTKDMLLLVPVLSPYARYQNMENVKGYGLDADATVQLSQVLQVNGNFTWQSLRLFNVQGNDNTWKEGARLRNTPYFFANVGLNANLVSVLSAGDRIRAYSYYSFVREYYLETIPERLEPQGFLGLSGTANVNTELVIPTQHLINAGFTFFPAKAHYTFGMEVKNITNQDLYDNYRVQKAGRSVHLKLTYSILKK